jgi:hypothetical protein
VDFEEDG